MKTIGRILSDLEGVINEEDILVDFDNGEIKSISSVDRDLMIMDSTIKNNKLMLRVWRIDKDANGVEFGGTFRY